MKQKLLAFYSNFKNLFGATLDNGKWVKNELQVICDFAVNVTGAVLGLLKSPVVNAVLSTILPAEIVKAVPEAETILTTALNMFMGIEAKPGETPEQIIDAFIVWLKSQPGFMQDAICQKLAAIILSIASNGGVTVTQAQQITDAHIHGTKVLS